MFTFGILFLATMFLPLCMLREHDIRDGTFKSNI